MCQVPPADFADRRDDLCIGDMSDPTTPAPEPFYLIVTDHDRGFFCVEGPMTDDRPWKEAPKEARNHQRRIACGPTGADRDAPPAQYRRAHPVAGAPPGSILRPTQ